MESRRVGREPISNARELITNGLKTIFFFIIGFRDDDVVLSHEDRMPRFGPNSTGGSGDVKVFTDKIVLGVGVCFAAIHCIAWQFSFPTHTELLLIWRVPCVAITAVPIYIYCIYWICFGY